MGLGTQGFSVTSTGAGGVVQSPMPPSGETTNQALKFLALSFDNLDLFASHQIHPLPVYFP